MSWKERAACLKANPDWFALPDADSHGPAAKELRPRYKRLALGFCAVCPVRVPCEDTATPWDKSFTVRGGIHPSQRKFSQEDRNHGMVSGKGSGRPRKRPEELAQPRYLETPEGPLTPEREVPDGAVLEYIAKGWMPQEIVNELKITGKTYEIRRRRDLLRWLVGRQEDAEIRVIWAARRKSGALYDKPAKGNGPAHLISTSECGRVVLVATTKGGRITTRFLRAVHVRTRNNGARLERFPADLLPE